MFMGINRILRPSLFVYECIRTILLAFTLVFLLRSVGGANAMLWMAFTAPAALFPIMILFLCIDANRYKNYLPLYIAGKCIGIIAFLGWSIFYGKFTMVQWTFEGGDLFALAAAIYLTKEESSRQ